MNDHRVLDVGSGFFAGFALFSFWQGVALAITIVSGLVAITLGCISLYDRIRYGPRALR
jgi:hypothetical protein